jgi:hypothetical protein
MSADEELPGLATSIGDTGYCTILIPNALTSSTQ